MLNQNNRALKEWAVVCDALRDGRQICLLRKGGIREEAGVFLHDHGARRPANDRQVVNPKLV